MILTTITPYWKRSEALAVWIKAISGARHPDVNHFLYHVGSEPLPTLPPNVTQFTSTEKPGSLSIGFYHNLGAMQSDSVWVMKMDVDTIPHVRFFYELLPLLEQAGQREWFNCGMVYMNRFATTKMLSEANMPLSYGWYLKIMSALDTYAQGSYKLPAATNFICRREDYIGLGGCDNRFRGYGWEDYQQIYTLEKFSRGTDPLPGMVTKLNVTSRCRDEISRPKAKELWERNHALCLLHRYHPGFHDEDYKNTRGMERNRSVLLDCVLRSKAREVI